MAAVASGREATAAALSQFEGLGAALLQCAAGATAMGVVPIEGTAIEATVSVRRRWVPLRLAPLRPGPTAAAAMTPTETTFAAVTTVRTERLAVVKPIKRPRQNTQGTCRPWLHAVAGKRCKCSLVSQARMRMGHGASGHCFQDSS